MKFFVQRSRRRLPSNGRVANHYYTKPTTLPPELSKRDKQPTNRLRRLRNLIALIISLCLLVFIISLNHQYNLAIDSQQYRSGGAYDAGVAKSINGLSSWTKLTINRPAITSSIKRQFPEADKVTVSTPLFSRTAKITLQIAPPTFTLSGAPGTFGQYVSYVIAGNGRIVGLAKDFPQVKDLPNLTDLSSAPVKPGELVLGQGTASFILAIIAQCQKSNVPVSSFSLAKNSQEIDLRTKDKAYYVKFNLAADPAVQIGQFLATRNQLAKSGEPSQYLDVRVDGRIFYK